MFNKEVVVRCESGLHNRQATYFVQKANEFESSIWLESGSRKMNAKSLLGIMSLGIVTGSTVTLSAIGPDEEAAVTALEALLQRDVYYLVCLIPHDIHAGGIWQAKRFFLQLVKRHSESPSISLQCRM